MKLYDRYRLLFDGNSFNRKSLDDQLKMVKQYFPVGMIIINKGSGITNIPKQYMILGYDEVTAFDNRKYINLEYTNILSKSKLDTSTSHPGHFFPDMKYVRSEALKELGIT